MKINKINQIFQQFYEHCPSPCTELIYNNNYTLLVAVVLSAQSTDKSVNISTKELFKVYDTPEKMLILGEDRLKTYIKNIGLYNSKAKNIIKLSKQLVTDYNSIVPDNITDLISLAGVGRKTANVVLNCAFKKLTMPVDTHVSRVSQRIGLTSCTTPASIEQDLIKIIPIKWLDKAHNWLVLHGRYICIARNPKCNICFISQYCQYFNQLNRKK